MTNSEFKIIKTGFDPLQNLCGAQNMKLFSTINALQWIFIPWYIPMEMFWRNLIYFKNWNSQMFKFIVGLAHTVQSHFLHLHFQYDCSYNWISRQVNHFVVRNVIWFPNMCLHNIVTLKHVCLIYGLLNLKLTLYFHI